MIWSEPIGSEFTVQFWKEGKRQSTKITISDPIEFNQNQGSSIYIIKTIEHIQRSDTFKVYFAKNDNIYSFDWKYNNGELLTILTKSKPIDNLSIISSQRYKSKTPKKISTVNSFGVIETDSDGTEHERPIFAYYQMPENNKRVERSRIEN